MPVDMMTVDKQLVPRREWIDKVRREYKVQQEEIDFVKLQKARGLKAAHVLGEAWRKKQKSKTGG